MKKLLPFSLLLIFSFLFMSCDNWKNTPVPGAELQMERTFTYNTTAEVDGASYTEANATSDFVINNSNGELLLLFSAAADGGRDHVYFTIPSKKVKHNIIGKYTLKSQHNNEIGDVKTYYGYHMSKTTSPTSQGFGSENTSIQGELVITGYDAKHKVLSGYFEVTATDMNDLTTYYSNPADSPRVDVSLKGEFKNVKLKEA